MEKTQHHSTGLFEEFLVGVAHIVWRFRVELALIWAPFVLNGELARIVGASLANVVTLAAVIGVFCHGRSRRFVSRMLFRARVRRRFETAITGHRVSFLAERRPRLVRIDKVPAGVRLTLGLRNGTHVGDIEDAAPALSASFSARDIRITVDPSDAAKVWLTVVYNDPLCGPGEAWPWVGAESVDAWRPIPLGLDEEGLPVMVSLPEHNLLIGGEPGGGKSAALSVLIAGCALDPSIVLWLLDGKVVELASWWNCSCRFAGADIADAIALLKELRAEMDARYDQLLTLGKRKVEEASGLVLHVLACDELALYTAHPDRKAAGEFSELLRDLVARGRAAGIVVLAATQKPSTDVVPSALRDLFGYRLALRCTTREASDTVLGSGWATGGYSAADIDPASRGVGLLLHESGIPVRFRTFYLDDEAVSAISQRAYFLRRRFGAPAGEDSP